MAGIVPVGQFVSGLYRRAYAAHGEEMFTQLAVPRWVGGRRTYETTSITLTPPLFSSKLRPIDTINNTTRHTFPMLLHAADLEWGLTKVMKLEYASIGAPWFVPMVYSLKARQQAREYLESVPLFLATNDHIIRESYHSKCGFPFTRVIKQAREF